MSLEIGLASGKVRGVAMNGVRRFAGIPYAAPPVGDLRWKPPSPIAPWTGVRDAFDFGPDSLQPLFPAHPLWASSRMSEDCLYANVWAPVDADNGPVLVNIHGGGFQLGSGAVSLVDGTPLAQAGLIVVTFNYRLGQLGFCGGSQWLQDQIAALQWVQSNIRAFGGDPARVTIAGVSAGGVSVNALNMSPMAAGLFDQAVMISGGGDALFSTDPHPDKPSATAAVAPIHATAFANGAGERPVVDGDLIPDLPSRFYPRGRLNARRLLIGFSNFESSLLDDMGLPADVMASALTPFAATEPEAAHVVDGYTLYDHLIFRAPAIGLTAAASAAGIESYLLDCQYVPSALRGKLRGSPHALAMYAMLGNMAGGCDDLGVTASRSDLDVASLFRARLVAFVAGGAPNITGDTLWHALTAAQPEALRISAVGTATMGPPSGLHDLARLAL
ncbi:MAG: carboxylesterase family protein [Terricaulis sp.]